MPADMRQAASTKGASGQGSPGPDVPVIECRGLVKAYGDSTILRGIDLRIERGLTHVIVGGSGAGKTVLLRQLIALERPTSGAVLVDGQDITNLGDVALNQLRRKFGMVFQGAALFDSMSVMDNVAFPLREHTRLSAKEIRRRVLEKLEILGLTGADKKFPAELSGGMRKRVGVARALMLEPAILIYDEPTTGLDPVSSRNVDDIILEMRDRFGITSVVITHDMATLFRVAERASMLYKGRIVLTGTPSELLDSSNDVVRHFLRASGVRPEALQELASE